MTTRLKTHTDYNLEQIEELQRVAGKFFARKQTMRRRSFLLCWGAVCMAGGLLLAVRRNIVVLALICCALGAFMLIQGIFFYQMVAWGTKRAMGPEKEGNDFFFEKSEIMALQGTESARYPYTDCMQLLETEKNLYFIMKNGQGLMMDKENVKGGTVDELRSLLEERCGQSVTWAGRKKKA